MVHRSYHLTPLHHAAMRGNSQAVELLLAASGVIVDSKDKQV